MPDRGGEFQGARRSVLVDARGAAEIARVHPTRWWGIAKRSARLRKARRARPNRTLWLRSVVESVVADGGIS